VNPDILLFRKVQVKRKRRSFSFILLFLTRQHDRVKNLFVSSCKIITNCRGEYLCHLHWVKIELKIKAKLDKVAATKWKYNKKLKKRRKIIVIREGRRGSSRIIS
jgi:hypothetical protein